jgi:transposase
VFQDTASALFGVAGLQVTDVQAGPGGAVEVWAVTDWPGAAACPDCGALSDRPHETVLARPRDARRAGDPVDLRWVKRRWKCPQESCERRTLTERLPQVPPRCRVTARLREQAAREVADRGITPAEAARHAGLSWPVVHDAFAARADRVLGPAPAPVAHLGIGEHPAWRDAVRVVAIDMCTIYASAVRRMLPGAVIAVDLFHVVQLAVKTADDVRRRAVRPLMTLPKAHHAELRERAVKMIFELRATGNGADLQRAGPGDPDTVDSDRLAGRRQRDQRRALTSSRGRPAGRYGPRSRWSPRRSCGTRPAARSPGRASRRRG